MKRIFSVAMAMVMIFSVCALGISANAAARIKKIEIVQVPDEVKFYYGTDWDYGEWGQPGDDEWIWYPNDGNRISFLRNPGGGCFPDAGMIDARGLIIKVYYSNGTSKNIEYKETKTSTGYTQNINVAPEKGAYKVGKMKAEVWLTEEPSVYATYDIELIKGPKPAERKMGDVNNDTFVRSDDALLILQHSVSLTKLNSTQIKYADMNNDKKINSSDALRVLQLTVGG